MSQYEIVSMESKVKQVRPYLIVLFFAPLLAQAGLFNVTNRSYALATQTFNAPIPTSAQLSFIGTAELGANIDVKSLPIEVTWRITRIQDLANIFRDWALVSLRE